VVTVIAGFVALLHQGGAIALDFTSVVLMGLVVLGASGAALVVLDARRR
jgi:hypothetical protein